MKNQKGFTLIELLLVLAIIGIISAIAIPALLGQRERAKAKAVQANVDAIAAELTRVSDTLKEQGTVLSASTIVTSVLTLPNYKLPNAKNPYDGSTVAYAAAGSTNGQVVCVGNAIADLSGNSYQGVTITGFYQVGGTAASLSKVVALD